MPAIDFIADELPKIDFVADESPPQRQPIRDDFPTEPSKIPEFLLPQSRLPERSPEQREFMETPLVKLPDLIPQDLRIATALGVPGAAQVEPLVTAAQKPVKEMLEGFTSPEGLVTLPALLAAPTIAAPVMGAAMLPSIPERIKATGEAIKTGDLPGMVEGAVGTVLDTAMVAGGLAVPFAAKLPRTFKAVQETGEKPPIIERTQDAIPQREAEALPVEEPPRTGAEVGAQVREQAATEAQAPEVAEPVRVAEEPLPPSSGGKGVLEATPTPEPAAAEVVEPAAAPVERPAATTPDIVGMGGAVPGEFAPTMRTSTGIKNAEVDKARAARGLDPIMKPARQAESAVWDRVMARIDREAGWQDSLIDDLKKQPRNLSPDEIIALDHRYVDLQNEYAKATREGKEAYDDWKATGNEGRKADVAAAEARAAGWESKLAELEMIAQSTGAEWGRSGHMRQRLLREDFTLEAMERKMRAAKGFQPLTDAERASLTQKAAELERINKELEAKVAEKEQLLSEAQLARTTAEMQATAAKEAGQIPSHIKRIVDRVGEILDTRAEAARKRLEGKLFTLSPEVLKDLAEIGASNIYHVGLDLTRWSAKMIADLGERIRPHLQAVWEASQKMLDDVTDVAAGKMETAIKQQVAKTIKVADTPQSRAEKIEGTIRERVGKGDMSIRALVQKMAREFVASGVTDRNALIDRVHGVLSDIIPDWTRRQTMDAISGYGEIKLLRKDEVSLRLRDLKGQMQQLGKLEDMAAGQAPLKTGLERRTPSDAERALIKAVNEAKRKGGYETTNPETQLRSALDEVKRRMATEIKDLERRLKEKDFAKPTKREIQLDKEALALEVKREKLKRDYQWELWQKKLSEESAPRRLYRGAQELANLWRAIRTSIDFSAVLNQGKFITLTAPARAARAIPTMIRSFMSEEKALKASKDILKDDYFPLAQKAKLYLADHGAPLSKMEEVYMSRWAEKVPLVAGSGRAYVAFLNKVRMDSFKAMVSTLGRSGNVSLPEAQVLANFINVSTGRGGIGIGERVGTGLNTWFFAPRFVASRFQMALGQPLYHGILTQKKGFLKETTRARKLVAMEYAKLLGAYSVFYALANMAGWKIGLDPKSSDFGKIIIGDTRIDPLAGLSQAYVLMSRTATGKKTSLKGKTTPLTGKVPFGQDDLVDVWVRFGRSKLAPVPSTSVDFLTGKDVVGQPIPDNYLELLGQYVAPISLQDIKGNMEALGVPTGIATTVLNLFGERIKTYDRKQKN